MYNRVPLSVCQGVLLSPRDACIDQFNTRPPTRETSLWRDVSSAAWPWTDKYQGEQRGCLSYPLHLQWRRKASVTANPCFAFSLFHSAIHNAGCKEEVLCGRIWLWSLVALNIGYCQGEWHTLSAGNIEQQSTEPHAQRRYTSLQNCTSRSTRCWLGERRHTFLMKCVTKGRRCILKCFITACVTQAWALNCWTLFQQIGLETDNDKRESFHFHSVIRTDNILQAG